MNASIYSIHYESEGMSSSVSDLYPYVIIRKLLDSMFHMLPVLIRQREIQTYLQRNFLP
jgi:hypothetical protein